MFEKIYRITPCYKCEERETGCHATCERYQTWKRNKEENGEKMLLELRELRPVGGYKK